MILCQSYKKLNKYAVYCTVAKSQEVVKYTDTVLLPKTKFPHYLNAKQTVESDRRILESCGFSELYSWQRNNVQGKEFTLLDGPPYANGNVHIGHAINKILKDTIIRSQLLQGRKVHFVPGWDCHGLPIELKAIGAGDGAKTQDPVQIRRKARQFARKTIAAQKEAFKSWGVMADWEKQTYQTFDSTYITRQLQIFWSLFSQGLLYRDLKPVYWSPSSRTALAEAELVYKDNHVSDAITLRLELSSHPFKSVRTGGPVYLLIWTTTPWTLPVNEAVCYSKQLKYSLVSIEGFDGLYIVGTESVPALQLKFKREIKILEAVETSSLAGLQYRHPWRANDLCPLLESSHVTASGTGMVHTAPAHGHDDFLVGIKHNLTKTSLVDEDGKYNAAANAPLSGLDALTDGTQLVLKTLKPDIIQQEKYTHSYPYDWRTDKPVLIRASQQWFIDTSQLKEPALECLDSVEGSTDRLRSLLKARPYWCVSRQRAWGVPIPVFYHKTSQRQLVNKTVVDHLCRHIASGKEDAWWTLPVEHLFPAKACQELCVSIEDIRRGDDILDIWLDSGVAWSGLEGRIADVCIEGGDQHTGWFQSSLLTSVACREVAPTRRLLTHGFAVDDEGRKMSKSVGNVVDPQEVVKTFGVDSLRWWAACHSHHSSVPAAERHLVSARETVNRLRGLIRFILGALHGLEPHEVQHPPITYLDKYMLDASKNLYDSVIEAYNTYSWHTACTLTSHFATGPVSGLFVHAIKDRLYCDSADSARRQSCRSTLHGVLDTLTACLSPVLPHLAEETYLHHPLPRGRFWYKTKAWTPQNSWKDTKARTLIERTLSVKAQVDKLAGTTGTAQFSCDLEVAAEDIAAFKEMQAEDESTDSELTEILQVSRVRKCASAVTRINLKESENSRCPRCRRFTVVQTAVLCSRCKAILQK